MSSNNQKIGLGIEIDLAPLKEGLTTGLKLAQKFVKQFPPRSQAPAWECIREIDEQ